MPAGPLGAAVAALGRQAGVSIAVDGDALWQRPVPAVRGRMAVRSALMQLARGSGARVTAIDARTWRLDRAAVVSPPPTRRSEPLLVPAAARLDPVVDDVPIIVTASKCDVRFDEFQGSLSRIDGATLDFGGVRGTDGVLAQLAGVSSTHLGAGRNKLFVRGIADSSFTGPTQATVGQYLGDIRLTYNAPDPDLRLYDIAAVEVLEGPQATLYGAGSLGGIIRIVRNPARPGTVEAAIQAGVALTQHGDASGDIGGMVNLPLGSIAALRVVAYGVSDGGYIDNPVRGRRDINRTRTAGGRAMLRIDAGDDWTIDVGATIQDIDGDDSQYADRGRPPLTLRGAIAQPFSADYRLGDLVIGKNWDGLRLLSSTGIAKQNLFERFDAGKGTTGQQLFTQANDTLLITNETRLWRPMRDGFGFVVGSSLIHNRTRLSRALGPVAAPLPVTGVVNKVYEATLFGEASWTLLDALTITGGGRLTRSRLAGDGSDIVPTFVEALRAARARITGARNQTRLLPSLALSSTAVPGVILFTRYSQGFRPGGLSVDNDFVRRFRSDRVATTEAGVRSGTPGRGRFDVAASFAYTRWTDIQADFVDGSGLPATANIGDGRIYSAAFNAGWRPVDGLSMDAAVIVNHSTVTSNSGARLLFVEPVKRIPNVARVTARIGADYRRDLGDDLDLHVAASARYTGRSRLGVGPLLGETQGDYLDTSLTARVGRPALGVTLTLTNLADSVGNRFALGTPFEALRAGQITPLRPRTLRLGIDAHF